MARSVSVPVDAEVVCFQEFDGEDWDDFVWWFRETCQDAWPSLDKSDDWIGRENHVLLENGHARIGVSEYCGLVSLWIVPYISDYYPEHKGLALHWIDQIAPKFHERFGRLRLIGRASNGEAFFTRIEQEV